MIGITNSNTSTIYVGPTEPTSGVRIWLDTDEEGASAVNSVNNKNGTVVLDADDVGAMSKWELLWTNASPTSSFAAQTIAVDVSGYDMMAVLVSSSSNDYMYTFFAAVGMSIIMNRAVPTSNTSAKLFVTSRNIESANANGISFSACQQSTVGTAATAANVELVPRYIYGIKGVTV